MGILLDKLLNYRVIDPTSVISWIFEPEQLGLVGRYLHILLYTNKYWMLNGIQ
jgi:hypothetical protein